METDGISRKDQTRSKAPHKHFPDESGPLLEHQEDRVPVGVVRGSGANDSVRSNTSTNVLPLESRWIVPSDDASVPFICVDHTKSGSGSPNPNDDYTRRPEERSPYLGGVSQRSFRLIFGVILSQYFVTFLDNSMVNTIHPVISSEFHSSNSASWLETAFLLTSTAFQPLAARSSDTIGRRPVHLVSLFTLAATTAWLACAPDMSTLIAARALCGLGAGGVLAMSPVMMNDLIPIALRGTYQGYINLSVGLASALGAIFGGLICDHLGWRWAFGIQVPLIVLIFAIAFYTTPSSLGPHLAKNSNENLIQLAKELDLTGSFLLGISIASLILGLNLGGNVLPWRHPIIICSLILSVVAGVLLVRVEHRVERPVMPLKMLSTYPRASLVFSNFFAYMGNSAILFNAPIFFKAIRLESASTMGFRLALPNLAVMVFGVWSGLHMTRTGNMKGLIVVGSLFMVLGATSMSFIGATMPSWVATVFLIPASIGMGLNTPATSVAVLATTIYDDQAVMTTTLSLWRRVGAVMGVAISSLLLQNVLFIRLDHLVTGAHKMEIIEQVRKSVDAIFHLSTEHQIEVRLAYETSLRAAFTLAAVAFTASLLLILRLKLPNLLNLPRRI